LDNPGINKNDFDILPIGRVETIAAAGRNLPEKL